MSLKPFKQLNNLNNIKLNNLSKHILSREQELKNIELELKNILNNIYNINNIKIDYLHDTFFNRLLLEEDLKLFSRFSEQKMYILNEIDFLSSQKQEVLIFDNKVNKLKKTLKKQKLKKKEKKLFKNLLI